MSKMNQKNATVNAILSVLSARGVDYRLGGDVNLSDVINDSDKQTVRSILFTAFKEGKVEYKESFQDSVNDDSELKKYISGLLNNWIRKNKDFNCGVKYEAKNPGSRAGSQDESIKAMRALLSITPDAKDKAAIQSAIDAKLAEIQVEKKQVTIDLDAIPEELKKMLGL